MAGDVRHRIPHLDLCLHNQALVPSREKELGPLSGNLVKALPVSLDMHPFINCIDERRHTVVNAIDEATSTNQL